MTWNTMTVGDSRLVLHCGANRVDWNEVRAVRTPDPTASHCPVPHDFLVEQVREGLDLMGFAITEEVHALYGDGLRYFGLLGLREKVGHDIGGDTEIGGGRQFVFGIRNGHDKSVVAGGVLGTRVFVCDNLALHSGEAVFKFARKHTRWALRDLPQIITTRLGDLRMAMRGVAQREEAYAAFDFSEADARANVRRGTILNDTLMRCLRTGAITATALPHIVREFDRADGPGGHAHAGEAWQRPTVFRLQQAVTEVEKERPGLLNLARRHSRLNGILDSVVTGREVVDADAVVEV
jgi:hypothetical protein